MDPRAKEKNGVKIFYFVFFFAEMNALNSLVRLSFLSISGKILDDEIGRHEKKNSRAGLFCMGD